MKSARASRAVALMALLLPALLGGWLGWTLSPGASTSQFTWERSWLDRLQILRIWLRGARPPDPDLVLIGVDGDTAALLGKPEIFWMSDLATLARGLLDSGARGVAFDYVFSVTGDNAPAPVARLLDEARLPLLVGLTEGNTCIGFLPEHSGLPEQPGLPEHRGSQAGLQAGLHNHPDLEAAAQQAGGLASLAVHTDADGTTRSLTPVLPLNDSFEPALSVWMVQKLGHAVTFNQGKLQVDEVPVGLEGTPQTPLLRVAYRTPWRPVTSAAGLLKRLRAGEKLQGFSGKVCLIAPTTPGEDLRPSVYDLLPSKREAGGTLGAEHHLAAAETLLSHQELQRYPAWLGALLSLLSGVGLCLVGRWIPLRGQWLALPVALLLGTAGNVACFVGGNLWLPLVAPALAGVLGYGCGYQWRHVTVERRRRLTHDLFSRMVSPQVVDKVLSDPSLRQLGGSERRVTVLYTDINHFTPMCERHTPPEVIDMLNSYFEAMVEIVFAHAGLLKQFVGDEIMVIYGAPAEQPDHAARAVTTALDMLDKLAAMEREARGADGFFDIKVGINTGDVVMGHVGSEQHMEYAAVGDDVNLGARIMATTKSLGVKILVSETTRLEAQPLLPDVEWISHGVQSFKGKTAQIEVYEVRRRPS